MDGWLNLAENQNRSVEERGEKRSSKSEGNNKTMGKGDDKQQKMIKTERWVRK